MSSEKTAPCQVRHVLLTAIFAAIISVIVLLLHTRGISGLNLFGQKEVQEYLRGAFSQPIIWWEVFRFVLAWFSLYVIWAAFICFSFRSILMLVSSARRGIAYFFIFLFSLVWIYAVNTYFYPDSSSAVLKGQGFQSLLFLVFPGLVIFGFFFWSLIEWFSGLERRVKIRAAIMIVAFLTLPLLAHFISEGETKMPSLQENHNGFEKPNIIIIGIDALRPDRLGINGFSPSVTPFLDSFLQQSTLYENTYTPLARTFAAWVSILSGRYPLHQGARFNLTPPELVEQGNQIQDVLRKKGYHSIYAIDERRFNNIDESYGFNQVVGPKIGFADMLLSPFSDDPLLNLVSQTKLGEWLFPYSYNNRGHHKLYDPYSFVDQVINSTAKIDGQPLFLAMHLTLPHWPFVNKNMPDIPFPFDKRDDSVKEYYFYLSMLSQVDDQLRYLVDQLKAQGLLKNAEVFVISDHGESFNLEGDGPSPAIPAAKFTTIEPGHGTNVLTLNQYRVLLAHMHFRNGNKKPTSLKRKSELRSLVDIAPTIAEIVGASLPETDGISLFGEVGADRAVFLESSINPKSISRKRLNVVQTIAEGVAFYEVNDKGLVLVKKNLIPSITASKQRAIIQGDWELAYFADMKKDLVLSDLKENQWWPSRFVPDSAPTKELLEKLCLFYNDDHGFDPNGYCKQPSLVLPESSSNGDDAKN